MAVSQNYGDLRPGDLCTSALPQPLREYKVQCAARSPGLPRATTARTFSGEDEGPREVVVHYVLGWDACLTLQYRE